MGSQSGQKSLRSYSTQIMQIVKQFKGNAQRFKSYVTKNSTRRTVLSGRRKIVEEYSNYLEMFDMYLYRAICTCLIISFSQASWPPVQYYSLPVTTCESCNNALHARARSMRIHSKLNFGTISYHLLFLYVECSMCNKTMLALTNNVARRVMHDENFSSDFGSSSQTASELVLQEAPIVHGGWSLWHLAWIAKRGKKRDRPAFDWLCQQCMYAKLCDGYRHSNIVGWG